MFTTHRGRFFITACTPVFMFVQNTLVYVPLLLLFLLLPSQTHGATFQKKSTETGSSPTVITNPTKRTTPKLAQTDLMIRKIIFSNERPSIGDTIKVTATIFNLSSTGAVKVPLSFIYKNQHKDIIIAKIDAHKPYTATADFKVQKPAGSQLIKVVINPKKTVEESNYSNNHQSKTFYAEIMSAAKREISRQKKTLTKQASGTISASGIKKTEQGAALQPVSPEQHNFTLPSEEECREYARSAVALAEIAERNHCGYQGSRWINDEEEHFNWCMTTGSSARIQESNARQSEVNFCIDCRLYAKEAVEQFELAEENSCKFTGSGWQDDSEQHFGWCMSASPAQRQQEKAKRDKALKTCEKDKRFDAPEYMGLLVDFCMYRRTEKYNEVQINPGPYTPAPVSFDYDYGWSGNNESCGGSSVVESFCISQGYDEVVDFKVAAQKSPVDTMPLGNAHKCNAAIDYSNCRGFDFITCRKTISDNKKVVVSAPVTISASKPQQTQLSVTSKSSQCTSYAEKAVQQSYQADSQGCEVNGEAWTKDLQAHVDWCMAADAAQLEAETNARRDMLQTCANCRSYAEKSVGQYHQANSQWCTVGTKLYFSPDVWHGDMGIHYNWCLSAGSNQPESELDKRDAVLDKCNEFQRIYFDKPSYNGYRVDIRFTNSSSDIQKSADAFCSYKGYARAVNDWQGYAPVLNSIEKQERTIHIGNGVYCSNDPGNVTAGGNGECEALDHIICEKAAISEKNQQELPQAGFQPQPNKNTPAVTTITNICDAYAEEAISQYQQAEALHCGGISMETWSQNPQYLKDWCMAADDAKRQQQSNARKAQLQQCKDCYSYAHEAVAQYHEYITGYCAIGQAVYPLWNGDMDEHIDWCRNASPAQRQAEINKRNDKLQECHQTEKKRFEKPVFNGKRVDVYLNPRNGNQLESDVPQKAADAFCQRMGYTTAINDWSYYNSPFTEESMSHTIHMGDGLPECNTGAPSYHKECKAFSHIICERPGS